MARDPWLFDEWFDEKEESILKDIEDPILREKKVREWLAMAYILARNASARDRCETCPLCNGKGKVNNKALPKTGPMHVKVECYHCRGVGKVLKKEE